MIGVDVENLAAALVVEMELRAAPWLRAPAEKPCRRESGRRSKASSERPSCSSRCTMHQIGVMPMPPANSTTCSASSTSGEIVARRADLERAADAQFVVHVARAAAAGRIALDADGVARGVGVGADQRVLPDEPVRQMQVDMRARLIGRQRLSVEPCEFVEVRVARRVADRGHAHLDQAVGRCLPASPRLAAAVAVIHRRFSLRQRWRHRARKLVCQLSGMRYASDARNPTGGKAKRIPGGAGARRGCVNAPGGRKIECAGATGAQGRTD